MLVVAGGAVMINPLQAHFFDGTTSVTSRQRMWSSTLAAIRDHLPTGTGVGSFPEVHRQYEDPSKVTRTFVNHAHNDYLEIALETGVAGILLLFAFLVWWVGRTALIWRSALSDRYARAASIASGSLLLHSTVDYPLRTAALSATLAACVAIMARPRTLQENAPADLWPTRHTSL
jgi:O-antigen ligase